MSESRRLAYVFWHWPREEADPADYRSGLVAFHDILKSHAPSGFLYSSVFRITGAPWANGGGEAYEDWYVLDGSAALDVLNDSAVSGARESRHDRVAALAAGGAAGLYRLREGEPAVPGARLALWMTKPDGVNYSTYQESLTPFIRDSHSGLWGRQMVLGPTPEFCLMVPDEPDGVDAAVVHRVPHDGLWP